MDDETTSGLAGHRFFYESGTTVDSLWRHGRPDIDSIDPPISLKANLNWMARRIGPPAVPGRSRHPGR